LEEIAPKFAESDVVTSGSGGAENVSA